jgi:hypothetical protein
VYEDVYVLTVLSARRAAALRNNPKLVGTVFAQAAEQLMEVGLASSRWIDCKG